MAMVAASFLRAPVPLEPVVLVALPTAIVPLVRLLVMPSYATVDLVPAAVRIQTWWRVRRFRRDQIARIESGDKGVAVLLRSGDRVTLRTTSHEVAKALVESERALA
jgi:hypothetical protein